MIDEAILTFRNGVYSATVTTTCSSPPAQSSTLVLVDALVNPHVHYSLGIVFILPYTTHDYALGLGYSSQIEVCVALPGVSPRKSTARRCLSIRYGVLPINVTLPEPGQPGSLGYGHLIAIDTTPPHVTNVTSAYPSGTYTIGATIEIVVNFNAPVVLHGYAGCGSGDALSLGSSIASSSWSADGSTCDGMPVLTMDASGEEGDANATYVGGNGTVQLIFTYEVSFTSAVNISRMGNV